MHLSDGILPPGLWMGGWAVAGSATLLALRELDERRIPRVAVMTSLFFIASSVSIPLPGVSSLHLLLNGLMGIVLGWAAVPALLLALLLQALLLHHGGITSLGANTVAMGTGAMAGHYLFRLRRLVAAPAGPRRTVADAVLGAGAGAAGVLVSSLLVYAALRWAYRDEPSSRPVWDLFLVAQLPLLAIEPVVTGFAVAFLSRVKPDLLEAEGSRR